MRKFTFGIVVMAAALLATGFVLRAPHPATASAPNRATIDTSALHATAGGKEMPETIIPLP